MNKHNFFPTTTSNKEDVSIQQALEEIQKARHWQTIAAERIERLERDLGDDFRSDNEPTTVARLVVDNGDRAADL